MTSRRDHLKNYLFSILTSGELKGAPAQMASQAAAIFAEDLPAALSDLAGQFGSNLTSALLGKLGDVVTSIRKQGLRTFWRGVMDQYDRGAEAKSRARK